VCVYINKYKVSFPVTRVGETWKCVKILDLVSLPLQFVTASRLLGMLVVSDFIQVQLSWGIYS
jgi:hypothetical protein